MEKKARYHALAGVAAAIVPLSMFGLGMGDRALATDVPGVDTAIVGPLTLIEPSPVAVPTERPQPVEAEPIVVPAAAPEAAAATAASAGTVIVTFDHPDGVDACSYEELTVIASGGCEVVQQGGVLIRTAGAGN